MKCLVYNKGIFTNIFGGISDIIRTYSWFWVKWCNCIVFVYLSCSRLSFSSETKILVGRRYRDTLTMPIGLRYTCTCLYIYVCMYVCMYVCVYLCMYVCVCMQWCMSRLGLQPEQIFCKLLSKASSKISVNGANNNNFNGRDLDTQRFRLPVCMCDTLLDLRWLD